MNDYTDSAVALLAAAVNRRRNARSDELVDEVWKLYDMAEGFAEALAMLDLDEGKFHPYTVRGARIVSVSEEKGLQVSWLEPDRDTGQMVPNDAYVGSLRHAWQRAALRSAKDLAGSEQTCSIYLSYEKQDGYTNSNGQSISWIRRVLRVRPDWVADRPAPAERQPADPQPRTPDPSRTEVAPEPQRQPEPPPVEERPAPAASLPPVDSALIDNVVSLIPQEQVRDNAAALGAAVMSAYQLDWWNLLGRDGQAIIRQANDAAKVANRPSVDAPHDPKTVGDLKLIANFSRALSAAPVPA